MKKREVGSFCMFVKNFRPKFRWLGGCYVKLSMYFTILNFELCTKII